MMRFAACVLVLGAALPLSAQSLQRLTLREAEQIALKNNASIQAARYSALAAAETPTQFAAVRQPVVTANLTGAGAPENSRLAAGALNNPVIYSRVASGMTVSQLLLDFGRTSNLVESSRFRARAEEESTNATASRIVLEVDRAYFNAMRAGAVQRVAERTVEARQLIVDQVTELTRARLKSELDLSFAKVNLEEAKLLLATAENERRASYANLSAVLGYEDPREFDLTEEAFAIEPVALSDLLQRAVRERPDLRALGLQVEAANRFVKAEHASNYPVVSAVASAGVVPERNEALRGNYAAVGVNVTLPFLKGGLLRSRETEAQMRAQASRERERELRTQIIRDLSVALLNLNTAAQQVQLTASLHEQAGRAMELAQSRYDLGLSSIVELSQAQLALTSAVIQNTNAKYNYQIQKAILDYQAGGKP
jgi:outer membrane protein